MAEISTYNASNFLTYKVLKFISMYDVRIAFKMIAENDTPMGML